MAQETCCALLKTHMVAELLARSPEIFAYKSPPHLSAMAAPGMTPGEEFIQTGVAAMQTVEFSIGGVIQTVSLVVAATILGQDALMEAKEVLAQKLTDYFSASKKPPKLENIEQDELDGTPEAAEEDTAKKLEFDDCNDGDDYPPTTVNGRYKANKAKFEALAAITNEEAEPRTKKMSVEEMLEAQRQEYQIVIAKLLDEKEK